MITRTTCPICNKKQVSLSKSMPGYNQCNWCMTMWATNKNHLEYSNRYYREGSKLLGLLFSPIKKLFYLIRMTYSGNGEGKVWIDIGAGDGEFLYEVSAVKKIAVESSVICRQQIKKYGIKAISDKTFMRSHSKADIITMWHVLEHLNNPVSFLNKSVSLLNKSGIVVIGVPNIDSFEYKLFRDNWFHLAPQYHLWYFSPKSLKILIHKSHLNLKYIDYFAVEHHFSGILQSVINSVLTKKNILHALIKRDTGGTPVSNFEIAGVLLLTIIVLPFTVIFWIFASVTKKSGTIVAVATNN